MLRMFISSFFPYLFTLKSMSLSLSRRVILLMENKVVFFAGKKDAISRTISPIKLGISAHGKVVLRAYVLLF